MRRVGQEGGSEEGRGSEEGGWGRGRVRRVGEKGVE